MQNKNPAPSKHIDKVNEIYQNYGIDTVSMDEGDLTTVYDHYLRNPTDLESDLERSRKHSGKFDSGIL